MTAKIATTQQNHSQARFTKSILVICACFAWGATGIVQADTYRWIDANGVVNYSEKKPRGVDAVNITSPAESRRNRIAKRTGASNPVAPPAYTPSASQPSTSSRPQRQPELNQEQQDILKGLEANEAERQDQLAKIRQDNCERSRRVLSNLTARDRIRVRSETGVERVMPEDERQQKISDAQRGIAENCSASS